MPTTPSQFRLSPETIADLDACRVALGLSTRTAVVQFAVKRLADEFRAKPAPKKTSRKSKQGE